MKRFYNILSFLFGLVLLLILLPVLGNPEKLLVLLNANWIYIIVAFVFTLLINLIAAFRWLIIIKFLNNKIPIRFWSLFRYTCLSRVIAQLFSQNIGGTASRVVSLSKNGASFKISVGSVLLDRVADAVVMFSVAPVAVLVFTDWVTLNAAFALVGFAAIVFAGGYCLFGVKAMAWWMRRRARKRESNSEFIVPAKASFFSLLNTIILSWVKYALVCLRIFIIAKAFEISFSFTLSFFGAQVSQIGQLLGLTPGGLGVVEAGWAGVLHLQNFSNADSSLFVVGLRLTIFLLIVIQYCAVSIVSLFKKKIA